MSRWDSSTGTLLFWPDRSCLDGAAAVLQALDPHRIRVLDEDWHNPMEWLDPKGQGVFIRLVPLTPFSDDDALGWGGIDWDTPEKAEAVLHVAESLALRTRNRWFALCDYQGWEDDCTEVVEVASFAEFRSLLAQTSARGARAGRHRDDQERQHPVECHVYKVHGPPWMPAS